MGGSPGRYQQCTELSSGRQRQGPCPSRDAQTATLVRETKEKSAAAHPLNVAQLGEVIAGAYARLGSHRGQQTWAEAARRTKAALRILNHGEPLAAVEEELERARQRALLGDAEIRPHPIQVMNLHQTKGREADTTVLVLQPGEYHGDEQAPYPTLSRLLYVVLTRARLRAYIAVPDQVHPLWRPLVEACEAVSVGAGGR